MMPSVRGAVMTALVAAWLVAAGPAVARTPQVRDVFLFSPAARQQANNQIEQINHQYVIELRIETFKTVPKLPIPLLWRKDKETNYADWAKNRARDAGDRGIYMLICREPAPLHVEVVVGNDPQLQAAFPVKARDQLHAGLLAQLNAGHADDGLRKAVEFVGATLRDNLGIPFSWTDALRILVPFLAVWTVLEFLRQLRRVPAQESEAITAVHGCNGGGSGFPGLFTALANGDFRRLLRRGAPAGYAPISEPEQAGEKVTKGR